MCFCDDSQGRSCVRRYVGEMRKVTFDIILTLFMTWPMEHWTGSSLRDPHINYHSCLDFTERWKDCCKWSGLKMSLRLWVPVSRACLAPILLNTVSAVSLTVCQSEGGYTCWSREVGKMAWLWYKSSIPDSCSTVRHAGGGREREREILERGRGSQGLERN